jgi:hypothetical protein
MSNTLTGLIPTIYAALDTVSRELVGFVPAVSRDSSAERAAKDQTIRSFVAPTASTYDISPGNDAADNGDQTISYVDMTISKSKYAPVRWTGEEQRSISDQLDPIMRDQFAQAMRALVNEVETDIGGLYVDTSRAYGTAGTTPFGSNLSDAAQMLKILKDNGAPNSDLNMLLGTAAGANLRSLSQLTNVNQAGTEDTLRRGVLLDIHGFAIRESAGIQDHTAGSVTDTTVTGANSVGATTIGVTTAASTGAVSLSAGDFITIAGGDNKYVVAEDVTIGADTTGDIVIAEPGLRVATSGSEAVATDGTNFEANMAFHRSALHLITRAPAMPQGGDAADDVMEVQDPLSGLAFQVAVYRQYRRVKYEVGLAWGVKCIKPEHTAMLLG